MSEKIKCAVIGVGYLGKFHAEKYALLEQAELIGVCDNNTDTAKQVANTHHTQAVIDYRELLGKVDAVSIAVPTIYHYEIAKAFLTHGVHVLIEKPITHTVEEAKELIAIAKKNDCILQVGHLERFNAARLALDNYLDHPRFIESNRLSPFKPRNTDVNVVLDLMIHDIDLIQSMVHSPISHIEAHGTPILTSQVDIANARITFENSCVANVTASRISFKTERTMRIFQPKCYLSIDFQHHQFAAFAKGDKEMFPGIPEITKHESVFEKTDALRLEIEAFLSAIRHNTPPLVSGEDGCLALETAHNITDSIHHYLENIHVPENLK